MLFQQTISEFTLLVPLFIVSICIKILLFPTYRSTDFDVHRNWLAVTHNLSLDRWYFDDVDGGTVHTLDYPPNFAYFEYFLGQVVFPIFQLLNRNLPNNCLELLPDSNNTPTDSCIVFQRSTVIMSDVVLWVGAYVACKAMYFNTSSSTTTTQDTISSFMKSFLLIVYNPGLLWLDHIHFQYNGMMLGVLLASLGLLMHANNLVGKNNQRDNENQRRRSAILSAPSVIWNFSFYHISVLGGAALYAVLVNFKHLYLPLGPLYFVYLLKVYCMDSRGKKLLLFRFLGLAMITSFTIMVPWIPFLLQSNPKGQILQILARLFPFQRGLVHDYWAANIWALYLLGDKTLGVATRGKVHLPEPQPIHCALLLLVSIVVGLYHVIWNTPTTESKNSNGKGTSINRNSQKLIQGIVWCGLCAFMLAYHVHEKAVLTALIPMTLLVDFSNEQGAKIFNFVFVQMSMFGLLGLFPLLFRPVETAFKIVSYVVYMAGVCHWCSPLPQEASIWFKRILYLSFGLIVFTIVVLEFMPIQGKYEFLPLLLTSTVCAMPLVLCWIAVFYASLKQDQ